MKRLSGNQRFWLSLVGALVLIIVVAAVGTAWSGSRQDLPLWLESTATVAALAAAIFAARYAANAFLLENERERRWEENQRRSQAEVIAAWFNWGDTAYMLSNRSSLPVFDVNLTLWFDGHPTPDQDPVEVFPPADKPLRWPISDSVLSAYTKWRDAIPSNVVPALPLVEMRFRDARGQNWRRTSDGRLIPIAPPDMDDEMRRV